MGMAHGAIITRPEWKIAWENVSFRNCLDLHTSISRSSYKSPIRTGKIDIRS